MANHAAVAPGPIYRVPGLYTEQELAAILAESGCALDDDAACFEALVARGIRSSQIACDWLSMKTRAHDMRARTTAQQEDTQ